MNKLTDFLDSVGGVAGQVLGGINPPETTTVVQQTAPVAESKMPAWLIPLVIGISALGLIWVLFGAMKKA